MSILPGWDSLESTAAYAKGFTFAGFGTLFLLGICDVLAYVYSTHKDNLASAGRHLSVSQENILGTTLLPFAGERLDLYVYANDGEAASIANQLLAVLYGSQGSQWDVTVFGGLIEDLRAVTGIAVETTSSATPRDIEAARRLVSALVAQHLNAFGPTPFDLKYDTTVIQLGVPPRIAAPIRMTVGKKQ